MSTKPLKAIRTQRFLNGIARFLERAYIPVLIVFFLITLLLGSLALRLERKTTIRDLMPDDNPVINRFDQAAGTFEMVDRAVIAVTFEPQALEEAEVFAELFVEKTIEDPRFDEYLVWLKANLYDDAARTDWYEYLRYITRLLPPEDMGRLLERLSAGEIESTIAQTAENQRAQDAGIAARLLLENDPLNLIEFAEAYRREIAGNYQLTVTDGFLLSRTSDLLLIIGKPTRSPEDVRFSKDLTEFFNDRLNAAKEAYEDDRGVKVDDLLTIGVTGPHAISARRNHLISGDVVDMFISSFLLVVFLFVMSYGRPFAIFYVGLPLLSAEIWTLGIGYLLFGELNLLTAAFSAVIVGLGIDYAIHIFSRYLDERQNGNDPPKSVRLALSQTGLGTLIGGMTSALAFAAMTVSEFTGLREFGVMAALGIVLCLLHMFITFPCMLYLRERFRNEWAMGEPQKDLHANAMVSFSLAVKKPLMVVFAVITALLLWEASKLRITTDIQGTRPDANPALKLQEDIAPKAGSSMRSLSFVLSAPDEESLYQSHDRLVPELERLTQDGKIVRYDSLLSMLQRPEQQAENLSLIAASGVTADSLQQNFQAALANQGLSFGPKEQQYAESLGAGLSLDRPTTLAEFVALESDFIRPYLHRDENGFQTIIHVFPADEIWQSEGTGALTDEILFSQNEGAQNLTVTGEQTIFEELRRLTRESFEIATVLSLILVLTILFLHFRKISLVILTLVPLACAVIWMLGTMHLMGIDITFINFVATPIIIGIGIDDGVHIVEKYLHRGAEKIDTVIARCGKAVTLTSVTTILGFSSLFLADYAGFQSLGMCVILGVAYAWVSSMILLPILLTSFKVKHIRDEAPE